MIDFDRGSKVTGNKFYFLTGDDAWREMNLISSMLKYHADRGYTLVIPPYLVNRSTCQQAGILPRFEGDFYETEENLILIPTAETPLVGMHADEIFQERDLPIRYVAFSPCFRKEAGSHGKRDRGLKRVHQFHKVELFVICTPDQSQVIHDEMIAHVIEMLYDLEPKLNVRQVELAADDRSPVSRKTIDLEILVAGEWLEVSSLSNTEDNQSKIAQIRYKPSGGGKNIKCHLLNGSGVALPRLMLAMIELGR